MLEPFPEGVSCDCDSPGVAYFDVHLNIAQHVVSDGDVTLAGGGAALASFEERIYAAPLDSDVGGVGRFVGVLEGAAGDGDLAYRAAGGVQPDVCGGWSVGFVVALNIAAPDLEVPHVSTVADHAAAPVVADVAVGDVDLVKIDVVQQDPNALVVDFMDDRVKRVNTLDDQEEVAQLVTKYDLLAVPVVDDHDIIQGIVTADDALDKIIPTAWKKRLPRFYR